MFLIVSFWFSDFDEENDEKEWTKIVSKRKMNETVPDFFSKLDELSISDDTFVQQLLEQTESTHVIFYPDDMIYKQNPHQFMQDVVSLWNTPDRDNCIIVLGVECASSMSHRVIGLKVSSNNDYYQSLILPDYFTSKPHYCYTQYFYRGRLIGIITVPSSLGAGYPSVVQTDACEPRIKKGQLWARCNKKNKVIPQEYKLTGKIYTWFSQSMQTPSTEVSRCAAKSPQKMATSTHPNEEMPETIEQFVKAVDDFSKGHFVLVTGKIIKMSKQIEHLACVPWIAVYDFDMYSRDSGLLSRLEDVMNTNRCVQISTWKLPNSNLAERMTNWFCLRGLRELPESHTPDEPIQWFKNTKNGLDSVLENLAKFVEDYTVLNVILLWPADEVSEQYVFKFVSRFNDHFQAQPKLIIIKDANIKQSEMTLQMLIKDFKDAVTLHMHQDELSVAVGSMFDSRQVTRQIKYTLPVEEEHTDCFISEKDAIFILVCMDVLFLSNPYCQEAASDVEILHKEADKFFHGNTISWFAWYEFRSGFLEVERDIMKRIVSHINQICTHEYRSSVITLFHAPGGGGTTMAQRILWELHDSIPCAEVKKMATFEGLTERITFLYDKTHLPVLVLIDGEDESKVKQLVRNMKSIFVIFLYVKRYPYDIKEPVCRPKENKFYLKGEVSDSEANKLAIKFAERCPENKKVKSNLYKMSKEVCNKSKSYCVFEFGMATFNAEFKGIAAYVRGYLDLENNPNCDLLPWQRALQYLSLVYYYGQSSLPLQVFAKLLCLPSDHVVELDDFPYPAVLFVVNDSNYDRTNFVRIYHYLIAKEILEHTLNHTSKDHPAAGLSKAARKGLKDLCLNFIDYVSQNKIKVSSTIKHIITRTFIFRDNKDVGENETHSKKIPWASFSQIMIDIDSDAPFTGRLEVLEKLTQSFPDDPNFLAHLGRFYTCCRPEQDDKAEECFKHSLQLCEQQNRGKEMKDLDDNMLSTLENIYHMYGMMYKRKVFRETKIGIEESAEQFLKRAEMITEHAEQACYYFSLSRKQKPQGHDRTFKYGYTSELIARLHVCDFIEKNYAGRISNFLYKEDAHPTARFIKESLSAIEDLIVECYSVMDLENISDEFKKALLWYYSVFKMCTPELEKMLNCDDASSRRLTIATLKLKYYKSISSSHFNSVFEGNSISCTDLKKLVDIYEANFKDAVMSGVQNKRQLDGDYKEWMFAIRNEKFQGCYSVEKVLQDVRNWNDLLRSPTSIFYLFICESLVGFGTNSQKGISDTLAEAQVLKNELQELSKSISRPRYPREWLGKLDDFGIKCLISNAMITYNSEKYQLHRDSSSLLAISKGTIIKCTNKLAGFIDLDLGNNTIPVKVFFIPLRSDLVGQRFAGKRVQFNLAFTFEHGYEAFEVTLLKKYPCSNCGMKLEIRRNKQWVLCSCGNRIESDTKEHAQTMNE